MSSLKERNKRAAEKWKALPDENKKWYMDAARVKADDIDRPAESWSEAQRILRNMQKNVCVCIHV